MTTPSITPTAAGGVVLRAAVDTDCETIAVMVRELAAYEKLADAVVSSTARLQAALFGPHPRVFCEIAEWHGAPVGFALWFYNFSTFQGRHGIYLEDLFVRPAARGRGVGKALLGRLARRCLDEDLGRLDWSVLDWNAPAIAFYQAQGAELLDGWTTCRASGDVLAQLGRTS